MYNNYSIGKVFSLIECENRTPEIMYLNDTIMRYISDTREKLVRHDVMSHVYAYGELCPTV